MSDAARVAPAARVSDPPPSTPATPRLAWLVRLLSWPRMKVPLVSVTPVPLTSSPSVVVAEALYVNPLALNV